MPSYTAHFLDDNGTDRLNGSLSIVDAAAAAPGDFATLNQLSSGLTVTSGTLPQLAAGWVSGTAKQNPVARQIVVCLEIVCDGTANAATCAVAISADNVTYTTIATPGESSALNTTGGSTQLAQVVLPAAWWIKLTLSHTTVAQSYYY